MKKAIVLALFTFVLTAVTVGAAPVSPCRLRHEVGRQSVVIVHGPCFYRDFPKNCQVPSRITVGQRIYCPK